MDKPMQINRSAYDTVLDSLEIAKLAQLSQDETMIRAIKKVLLFGVYYNGVLKAGEDAKALMNFALRIDENNYMTNEQLGCVLRAKMEGLYFVEGGFQVIEMYKPFVIPKKDDVNPAR
mgnify:CR=1 FL=1